MTDWVCDINNFENGNEVRNGEVSANHLINSDENALHMVDVQSFQTSKQGPAQKRPRLFEKSFVHAIPNGLKENYNIHGPLNLPDFREEIRNVRHNFDTKLKNVLKEKLAGYLSCVETTRLTVNDLKDEVKQLADRMNYIESSSKDLTKLINDRIPLPAPTSGVGQERTLSSQAPRLPPPPLVSAPVLSSTSSSTSTVYPVVSQSTVAPTPPALCASRIANSILPNLLTLPQQNGLEQTSQVRTNVAVNINDTIDLTSDATPVFNQSEQICTVNPTITTIGSFPKVNNQVGRTISSLTNSLTRTLSIPTVEPHKSVSSMISNSQQNTTINQTIASQNCSSIPVSFIPDVHLLPVAVLPPVPHLLNPNPYHLPIQPNPQLTIAEAAEGVCLQWTISSLNGVFEPAVVYEIYSYASSEVDLVTVQTSLPWKKVGEVAALPLPMACTLTHVQPNNMYYFIVRSIDRHTRYSTWSNVVNAYVS